MKENPEGQFKQDHANRIDMQQKYLQDSVGRNLRDGLVEIVKYMPNDPIEYLGNFLVRRAAPEKPATTE